MGARPLWRRKVGGGEEPPRGTLSRRLLCTPGVRLVSGFCSPSGGVLALVCEPLFRTGPANENRDLTGHTFQRDLEPALTECLEGNTLSPPPHIRVLRMWG